MAIDQHIERQEAHRMHIIATLTNGLNSQLCVCVTQQMVAVTCTDEYCIKICFHKTTENNHQHDSMGLRAKDSDNEALWIVNG